MSLHTWAVCVPTTAGWWSICCCWTCLLTQPPSHVWSLATLPGAMDYKSPKAIAWAHTTHDWELHICGCAAPLCCLSTYRKLLKAYPLAIFRLGNKTIFGASPLKTPAKNHWKSSPLRGIWCLMGGLSHPKHTHKESLGTVVCAAEDTDRRSVAPFYGRNHTSLVWF